MISKHEVARQGNVLIDGLANEDEHQKAIDVLEMWRSAHKAPMEEMKSAVGRASENIDNAICVSRLKRRDTIVGKLKRTNDNYTLRNLDDIAGCRCIVSTVQEAFLVAEKLRSHPGFNKCKDYIADPKKSGYRGIHLLHRCDSPDFGYENLHVETQVRTRCQHAWATAVETYDVAFKAKLKFGIGKTEVLREFALISNLFAIAEGCSPVPDMPDTIEATAIEITRLDTSLRILPRLKVFSQSVSIITKSAGPEDVSCYLLESMIYIQQVAITAFSKRDRDAAIRIYSKKERDKPEETDVLFVEADSIENLKEAYPNYFSDISFFLEQVEEMLKAANQ